MDDAVGIPHLAAQVQAERTQLRLPSRPEWIEPAVEYLQRKAVLCGACLESQASKLTMALHEALNNSVVHGNLELSSELKERGDRAFAEALAGRAADPRFAARTVEVTVEYDGERCRWALTDEGLGFDVARVLRQADDPAALLASGRGILMMRAFMDDVRWELGGRRIVLTLHKPAPAEKRHHDRVPAQVPVRVAPVRADGSVDWAAAYEAVSRNFSQGGMAILHARLATTERVLLGIVTEGEPLYLPADVRHWRAVGDNEVEVGCRFQVQPPPAAAATAAGSQAAVEEVIAGLLERLGSPADVSQERRVHPRIGYVERIGVTLAGEEALSGFARDLSKGGIAFITTDSLPPGPAVLALPQGREAPPLRVRAQIVRCTRIMDGFFDVGARFVGVEA